MARKLLMVTMALICVGVLTQASSAVVKVNNEQITTRPADTASEADKRAYFEQYLRVAMYVLVPSDKQNGQDWTAADNAVKNNALGGMSFADLQAMAAKVACSPKVSPYGMRLFLAHGAWEIFNERQEAYTAADHREVASGRG